MPESAAADVGNADGGTAGHAALMQAAISDLEHYSTTTKPWDSKMLTSRQCVLMIGAVAMPLSEYRPA